MLPTNPLLNATAPAGPHLPVALLRQYAAGALATAAQHRVEAHTLACPRCADVLAGLLQTPPATTDQALAQLQQRLRQRVQAAPARQLAPRRHRWLAPQLAAAAALLLGLVAGGWWAGQQRHLATSSPGPVAVSEPTQPARSAAAPAAPTRLATQAPEIAHATAPSSAERPQARLALAKPERAERRPAAKHAAPPAVAVAVPADAVATNPPPAPAPAGEAAPAAATVAAGRVAVSLPDSAALTKRVAGLALHNSPDDAARVRATAMPAPAGLAPAPLGGTAALREKLRREATEFVPEAPEQRLSGTVQLRVTIGADGKIQQISVLRGLRADYDAEAQRLVCEGPAWVPGISGGRRAAQTVDVAVPF